MWFAYTLIHVFLLALVNYTDEYLINNSKLPANTNIHKKIGGQLLISMLMSFVGAAGIAILTGEVSLPDHALVLALISTIPIVIMYASYFYLLAIYPVHQVAPLFQISAIWLLIFELLSGTGITALGLIGILISVYGAYLLDAGTFKFKVPTKLLMLAIPATSTWAIALLLARMAAETGSPIAISFYQLLGIGILGLTLLIAARHYRDGLFFRIKNQGKVFLGLSLVNESLAESAYVFSNLAVAIAPIATFVTAMSGVQSIFVLTLFALFPQGDRTKVTRIQWLAVALIAAGIFLIERVGYTS